MKPIAFILFGILVHAGCELRSTSRLPVDSPEPTGEIKIPTDKQYAIYDFWAPWCGPCQTYTPVFEKLQSKYERPNVKFKRINIDEEHETAAKFHIQVIPTVVVTADEKEVWRNSGFTYEKDLAKAFR